MRQTTTRQSDYGARQSPRARGSALPVIAGILAVAVIAALVVVLMRAHGSGSSPAARPGPLATGPLVPAAGALFGAWVEPTSGFTTSGEEAGVAALEQQLGRKLAIDQLYVRWAAPMPLELARWDLRHGSVPMISWGGTRTNLIAAGRYDAMIRARALQLRDLHKPVMLRWFAEMSGGENHVDAVSPASYIAAWRHIHQIFTSVSATNVIWVWCPNASDFRTGAAQRFYPGSNFVNWIGADGYNWAPRVPDAPWSSFADIFSSFYQWGVSAGKPLMIGEFGVMEGAPGQKAAWLRQAARQLRAQFPAIRAVVYFDSDHDNFDWKVTTSPLAFAAFRAFATNPYFRARPAL